MRISIDHAPGEFAEKFDEVVDELRQRAHADGHLVKSAKTIADLEAQIMVPSSRDMFARAMDAISETQGRMSSQVDAVVMS